MNRMPLALDFDGVIHKYSAGWQDGSIYDDVMPGTQRALSTLSQRYRLRVLTAREDLAAVVEAIERWHLSEYFEGRAPANRKFGAELYVDDKGYRFTDWESALREIPPLVRQDLPPYPDRVPRKH